MTVTVTVNRGFLDLASRAPGGGHVYRHPGASFEATEDRAAQIAAKLPGYVSWEPSRDLSALTVKDLRSIASERGVDIPKGATKDRIVELLEG